MKLLHLTVVSLLSFVSLFILKQLNVAFASLGAHAHFYVYSTYTPMAYQCLSVYFKCCEVSCDIKISINPNS